MGKERNVKAPEKKGRAKRTLIQEAPVKSGRRPLVRSAGETGFGVEQDPARLIWFLD